MAEGYWVARVTVTDAAKWGRYAAAATDAVAAFGGRFLARGGKAEAVEGEGRPRNVIIAFPSLDAARNCYQSEAYQAAKALREGAGTAEIVIVEGVVQA